MTVGSELSMVHRTADLQYCPSMVLCGVVLLKNGRRRHFQLPWSFRHAWMCYKWMAKKEQQSEDPRGRRGGKEEARGRSHEEGQWDGRDDAIGRILSFLL